jgi:hypothetical protein
MKQSEITRAANKAIEAIATEVPGVTPADIWAILARALAITAKSSGLSVMYALKELVAALPDRQTDQ